MFLPVFHAHKEARNPEADVRAHVKHLRNDCVRAQSLQSCPTLRPRGPSSSRLLRPWDSLGKNTGVGCHALLQQIFTTQEWNQGLLHCRWILYQLSYEGSPKYAAAAKSLQSCPTLWPHRRQPARLPRPWDSPGKNTGVGCHFLLQCMKVKSESEVAQLCPTLSDPMDCSLPGSSVHGIFQARVLEWGPKYAKHQLNKETRVKHSNAS